jgi:hypothetical protein
MRLPRVQFTIKRMMVAVAVVALALVLVPPAYDRLAWLYNTPPGSGALFAAGVNPVRSPTPVSASSPRPSSIPVGQPFHVQCDYNTSLLPRVPTGLIYRATVEVKLMDRLVKGTVFESHRKPYFLISGMDPWKEGHGRFKCDLTPRRPGWYIVRYEIHFTDLFGREAMGACNTGGFSAR